MTLSDGQTEQVIGVLSAYWPCLYGMVFNDIDKSGSLHLPEEVAGGLAVQLLDAGGSIVATTTTSSTTEHTFMENFRFPLLDAGTYRLQVVLPSGAVPFNLAQSDVRSFDNTGRSELFALDWNQGLQAILGYTVQDDPPTWTLAAPPPAFVGPNQEPLGFDFDVVYKDDRPDMIDLSTVGAGNLAVRDRASGMDLPLIVTDVSQSGDEVLVTYHVVSPLGIWTALEEGVYDIITGPAPVRDLGGHAAQEGQGGPWSFTVDATPPVALMLDGFLLRPGLADVSVLWADGGGLQTPIEAGSIMLQHGAGIRTQEVAPDQKSALVTYYGDTDGRLLRGQCLVFSCGSPVFSTRGVWDKADNQSRYGIIGSVTVIGTDVVASNPYDSADDLTTEGNARLQDGKINLKTGSDAAFSQSFDLPTDAAFLSLDYGFPVPGDGDRMVISVNGTQVFEALGTDFPGTDLVNTGQIPINQFAGQTANVEVRLASSGPESAELQVDNLVLRAWPITDVPIGGPVRIVKVVEGGKTQTITLAGGQGTIGVAGQDVQTNTKGAITTVTGTQLSVAQVDITQSTGATSLIFSVAGGNGMADVGGIIVTGAIGSITGSTINVEALQTGGPARTITLRDVSGPIIIGGTGARATDKVTLTLGALKDAMIQSAIPILSLTAAEWLDTDELPDQLLAPGVTVLRTTGRPAIAARGQAKSAGDFQADLNLGTAQTPGSGLGSFMVVGTWDQSQVAIFGQGAGGNSVNLVSAGQVADASLTASGGVGTITAGSWQAGKVEATTVGSAVIRGNAALDMTLSGQNRAGNSLTAFTVLGDVTGSVLDLTGAASVINVRSWTGGSIRARYLSSLIVTRGAFGAEVNLTAQNAAGNSLNLLSVAGTVNSATITLAGGVGSISAGAWAATQLTTRNAATFISRGDFTGNVSLTGQSAAGQSLSLLSVHGEMTGAAVRARGGIGMAMIGSMRGSDLYVCMLDAADAMPAAGTTAGQFFQAPLVANRTPSIGTFMITRPAGVFEDSVVAAPSMGTVILRGVDTDNAGTAFGLVADTKINMLMRYRTGAGPSIGRNIEAGLVDVLPAEGDFEIDIL